MFLTILPKALMSLRLADKHLLDRFLALGSTRETSYQPFRAVPYILVVALAQRMPMGYIARSLRMFFDLRLLRHGYLHARLRQIWCDKIRNFAPPRIFCPRNNS